MRSLAGFFVRPCSFLSLFFPASLLILHMQAAHLCADLYASMVAGEVHRAHKGGQEMKGKLQTRF